MDTDKQIEIAKMSISFQEDLLKFGRTLADVAAIFYTEKKNKKNKD